MQVMLRAWTREDIPEIAELERACFSDPWSEEMFSSAFGRFDFYGMIAEADGEIAGYLCGTALFEEAELAVIAVRETFRGRGVGGAMLDAFIEYAEQMGVERMFLEARVSNASAIRLYESRGFERTRIRKKYYGDGEDAAEMVKAL